LEIKTV